MNRDDYLPELLQRLGDPTLPPAQASGLLVDACNAHPGDARPWLLLAAEYMQQRDTDRAEAAYVGALQRQADLAIARFQLGLLQFTSNRPALALTTWAPLDLLSESHCLRLFKQAFACLAHDDSSGASAFLLRGIEANLDNPPLNADMRMLLDKLVPPTRPAPSVPDAEESQAHFLVSAYQKPH